MEKFFIKRSVEKISGALAACDEQPDRHNRGAAVLFRMAVVVPIIVLLGLFVAPVRAQSLMVWGDNSRGQVSDAPTGDFEAISFGSFLGNALRRDGTSVVWGKNVAGQPIVLPSELTTERFRAVTTGRDDSILIRNDGTLAAISQNPALANVPTGDYRSVAVSAANAVAIAKDGSLATWGSDSPFMSNSLLNAPIGRKFEEVSSRVFYALALDKQGTLYGWGRGAQGTNVLLNWPATPEDPQIYYRPGEKYEAISAGNVHALALRKDGTVTGWGSAASEALNPPTHVRFKAIAAGWGFSVGLATDGTLWGWGAPVAGAPDVRLWTFESQGWTRYGDSGHFYFPNRRFGSVAAGAFNAIAVTADGGPGH